MDASGTTPTAPWLATNVLNALTLTAQLIWVLAHILFRRPITTTILLKALVGPVEITGGTMHHLLGQTVLTVSPTDSNLYL
tara:strand:- start:123 stop:365 length:243 start_codon:yes stop_codon:yes gene_type:complete